MSVGVLHEIATQAPRGQSLLGLDVGAKTIGLAVCDPDWQVATPLQTLKRTKFTADLAALRPIIAEFAVGGFVIGYPINMDATSGRRCQSIRDFAAELHAQLGGDPWIALWDERLSTASVEEFVDKTVEKRKTRVNAKSSGLIDRLAAQLILQGAMDYLQVNAR